MAPNDPVSITKDLVEINSVTPPTGERQVAEYIHRYLRGVGVKSELIAFGENRANVIASMGEGEGLMLNGHMDTVPFGDVGKWRYGTGCAVRGGRLYGRGSSDMKGAIACMLAALAGLDLGSAKRRLLLTFVAGEETGFAGTNYLLDRRMGIFRDVRYGIVGEATDLGVQLAQKGYVNMGVVFRGRVAHASKPWLGDSAILKAARFINAYQKLADRFPARDGVLGRGTANIGIIQGGTAENVVPDICAIKIDRRIVRGETPGLAVAQVRGVLKKLGAAAEVKLVEGRNAFSLDKNSRIVKFVRQASGSRAAFSDPTGYTEVELYKARAGIDGVVFGPGNREVIHQANEYVEVANLRRYTSIMAKVIRHWCLGGKV